MNQSIQPVSWARSSRELLLCSWNMAGTWGREQGDTTLSYVPSRFPDPPSHDLYKKVQYHPSIKISNPARNHPRQKYVVSLRVPCESPVECPRFQLEFNSGDRYHLFRN